MKCIMEQLYTDFIEPHIKRQPKDALYQGCFDDFARKAPVDEQDRTDVICEFYAIHAFLLGLRLGFLLGEDPAVPDGEVSPRIL